MHVYIFIHLYKEEFYVLLVRFNNRGTQKRNQFVFLIVNRKLLSIILVTFSPVVEYYTLHLRSMIAKDPLGRHRLESLLHGSQAQPTLGRHSAWSFLKLSLKIVEFRRVIPTA